MTLDRWLALLSADVSRLDRKGGERSVVVCRGRRPTASQEKNNAAEKLSPEYERSSGRRGFVCARVNPTRAGDRKDMLAMAGRSENGGLSLKTWNHAAGSVHVTAVFLAKVLEHHPLLG